MRIAFIGLGRYSSAGPIGFHLARALAVDHELRAFVGREALNLGAWVHSALDTDVRTVYGSAPQALASFATQRGMRQLAADINAYGPDVAVAPFFHLWHPALLPRLKCPTVMFVHDPTPHPGLRGSVMHALEKRAIRQASHVVIHTPSFRETVCDTYGVAPEDVSVVPIGPLSDYHDKVSWTDGDRTSSTRYVLFFGRMEAYKGLDVLLDVVPHVRQRVPDATFVLMGPGQVPAVAARAQRTPGVRWENRWIEDDEVAEVFLGADVLVLPYTSATQSGVIPVAAAFGVPVVATEVGGLREQLADGNCGVLVPVGDRAALAGAISNLLEDPVLARNLGDALRNEYRTSRSWTAIGEAVARGCELAIARGARHGHPA